jgi:hypothetical protein
MPAGSLAEAFQRYRGTPEWTAKAPPTREEWLRAWAHIEPVFGDVRPATVMLEHVSQFRAMVERKVSRREAHRVIKIWRALWRVCKEFMRRLTSLWSAKRTRRGGRPGTKTGESWNNSDFKPTLRKGRRKAQ